MSDEKQQSATDESAVITFIRSRFRHQSVKRDRGPVDKTNDYGARGQQFESRYNQHSNFQIYPTASTRCRRRRSLTEIRFSYSFEDRLLHINPYLSVRLALCLGMVKMLLALSTRSYHKVTRPFCP